MMFKESKEWLEGLRPFMLYIAAFIIIGFILVLLKFLGVLGR